MPSPYNRVAGQSVERLAVLSDGIFAFAMTLLVLDLRVPASGAVHSERVLRPALIALSPRLIIFLMSLMTLGIFWVGQQTQSNQFARADRNLAGIHIAFLCTVVLAPFSTSLLGEFIHYRIALLVYWFNILLLGLTLYWTGTMPPTNVFWPTICRPTFSPRLCASPSAKSAESTKNQKAPTPNRATPIPKIFTERGDYSP